MTRKPLLPIDPDTADVFGELAGLPARQAGRAHRTRVQDLWLASQAIQHSALLTRESKFTAGVYAGIYQHALPPVSLAGCPGMDLRFAVPVRYLLAPGEDQAAGDSPSLARRASAAAIMA